MSASLSISSSEVMVTPVDVRVDVNICENVSVIELGASGPQGPRGSQLLSGATNPSISIGLIGDQYINTDTGYLFGPKTADGWGVGVPLGNNDPNDLGQVYTQTSPSTVWNIVHTLTFVPNIIIVDSEKNVVEGSYEYESNNEITATFNVPISGKAFLS
jgi:hypothetical protein